MKKIIIILSLVFAVSVGLLALGSMVNKKNNEKIIKEESCNSLNSIEKTDCLMKKQKAIDFKYSNKYYQVVKGEKTTLDFEIKDGYVTLKRLDKYKNNLICNTQSFIRDIGDDYISFYGYKNEQILSCRHALDNEVIYFISETVSLDKLKEASLPQVIDFSKNNQYPEGAIFN